MIDPSRIPVPEHLSAEDAELYLELYAERNRVSRGEVQIVRRNIWRFAEESYARRGAA